MFISTWVFYDFDIPRLRYPAKEMCMILYFKIFTHISHTNIIQILLYTQRFMRVTGVAEDRWHGASILFTRNNYDEKYTSITVGVLQ